MSFRIGHGYDVHAFTDGDHLMLGGVRIPFHFSFAAHSDGDVLVHAVCDALLGSMALGDIGQHFPDTDEKFSGIDSRILLRNVMSKVSEKGYQIGNLDITIVAQKPKMATHLQGMRENLAVDLKSEIERVNVKATTTEKLGFAGRSEGIEVHCVVLLEDHARK